MNNRWLLTVALCVGVAGCQSTQDGKKQWVQFQPGDVLEVADAKCKLYAQSQQQGLYAQGNASFVAGAQIGNAIGNAIRMQQAYTLCMTIAGWKQVPVRGKKPA